MIYNNEKELSLVVLTVKQANFFIDNPEKQIAEMPKEFKDLLGFTAGAGVGATVSLAALYTAGITGLSAGIASGLAAIGGSMLGGIAALAAIPIALGIGGMFAFNWLMSDSLETQKKKLLKECKQIKPKLLDKTRNNNERIRDQAKKFIVLIDGAINDLTSDLTEV